MTAKETNGLQITLHKDILRVLDELINETTKGYENAKNKD